MTRTALPVDLPPAVQEVVGILTALPGAQAVVLGGSRVLHHAEAGSDWDLGLYYRGHVDLSALERLGTVHPPGSWGRIMNGGAWLQRGDEKVDVILRDLDVVDHWSGRARRGEFERDALLGYVAGIPTYTLTAELASCVVLWGNLEAEPFPPALAVAAPPVWRFCRAFSLDYARMHARRGNLTGVAGQAAAAVIEEAHAVACERELWVCNEKHLLRATGLEWISARFAALPATSPRLAEWVDGLEQALCQPRGT